MSIDIALIQAENGTWDIDFEGGDLKQTDGLDTALYMSVLMEKRAAPSQVSSPRLRRGHFTNEFNRVPNYEVGSLLWFYTDQQKILESTLINIEDTIISDGTQWMIEDNILKTVSVSANVKIVASKKRITLDIKVTPTDETQSRNYQLFVNTFTVT